MHALTWIDRHGRFLRHISAESLRKATGNISGVCTWCGCRVAGRKRHWCGEKCLAEFRVRCQPGHARDLVEVRDRGVCRICGFDTTMLCRFSHAEMSDARAFYRIFGVCSHHGARKGHRNSRPAASMRNCTCPVCRLEFRSSWEMDHIRPVCRGGGLCGLDNLRLLCGCCHGIQTDDLVRSRRLEPKPKRRRVKKAVVRRRFQKHR